MVTHQYIYWLGDYLGRHIMISSQWIISWRWCGISDIRWWIIVWYIIQLNNLLQGTILQFCWRGRSGYKVDDSSKYDGKGKPILIYVNISSAYITLCDTAKKVKNSPVTGWGGLSEMLNVKMSNALVKCPHPCQKPPTLPHAPTSCHIVPLPITCPHISTCVCGPSVCG